MSELTDSIQKVTELATGEFAYVFARVGECSGIHHSVLLTNCTYEKLDEIIIEYLSKTTQTVACNVSSITGNLTH
jgi:ubiquinone biosynthesis protein Coq4